VIAVRAARLEDAEAMSAVLIASITELCTADHKNDVTAIAEWTANKTPESVRDMMRGADSQFLVVEHEGEIAAVGAYAGREIRLNYVHPAHRFAGVSKALLNAMETAIGPGEARLEATNTAQQFYRTMGWTTVGASAGFAGATCQTMRKVLA
jgi:N-acetylglutamate synthase-like GNAT family acetyltransferase